MALTKEKLLDAYRVMRTIRDFELRISKEFALGTVPGMTHLYIGQEAVAAGICADLTDMDYIASTHRGHGHCIEPPLPLQRPPSLRNNSSAMP